MSKVTMPEPVVLRTVMPNDYRYGHIYGYTGKQMESYAAAKVRESQKWQPIETAPKDGTEIIGWNGKTVTPISYRSDQDDDGHIGWCQSGYTNDGMLFYNHYSLPLDEQPTHWKPLPPPPAE